MTKGSDKRDHYNIWCSNDIVNFNTTGATSGARTAHPSQAYDFTPGFPSLVFYVLRCRSFCHVYFDNCIVCPSSTYGF